MLRSEGLLSQLQRQSGRDLIKEKEGREGRAGGRGGIGECQQDEPVFGEEPQLVDHSTGWNGRRRRGNRTCNRQDRQRAGGKGEKNEWSMKSRMAAISKKLSMICRRSREFSRQKDGFIPWREIEAFFSRGGNLHFGMAENEVKRIVNGEGGNFKMRFEWGKMKNGERALRTPQGHSKGSGVTSDYLPILQNPVVLVHGTSLENAQGICTNGVSRVDRVHIHLGRMMNSKPVGIRHGSQVAILVGGNLCEADGIPIYQAANRVVLTEGRNGVLPPKYITQAYEIETGRVLFNAVEGRVEEQEATGVEEDGPFTELSWEEDSSPITRTCTETGGFKTGVVGRERPRWVNRDPFDGNVEVEIELDSNVSMAEGSSRRNRSSLGSMSTVVQSEEVNGEEGSGSIEDGSDTQIHSPERWNEKFYREGQAGVKTPGIEEKGKMNMSVKRKKCEKEEKQVVNLHRKAGRGRRVR